MACLAPQFKWPPSSHLHHRPFANHSAAENSQHAKAREPGCLRIHCVMSPAASAAAAVDADRPASSGVATMQLGYGGGSGLGPPPAKSTFPVTFEAALATETLLNEEAMVAAAAAEAVALARAAVEAAKEAARMVQSDLSARPDKTDNFLMKEILRTEVESGYLDSHTTATNDSLESTEFSSIVSNELELKDAQHAQSIAVKSTRQSERRARRARAAEKAAANVDAEKPTTSSKKKRYSATPFSYLDPLSSMWRMASAKLLTAKEEVELSKGIQDLLKLEAIQEELAEYNGGQPTFSQWAAAAGVDQNTLRKRLDHGTYCKNRMIASNVRLVISVARNFEGVGMELSDLVQEGCKGLIRGAEKFDASKGFKFSTYSHWWIKQAIRKCVSEDSRLIRLPAHVVDATYRVRVARKRLTRELGRQPDNSELAAAARIPIKRLEAVLQVPKYTVSLDQKIGFTDITLQEVMADPRAKTAEEILNKWLMKRDVNRVLDTLNERERQVIRWRFGFQDGRMRTLQEIGEIVGVSRERIRQIESSAFRKLKIKKRAKTLRHYVEPYVEL